MYAVSVTAVVVSALTRTGKSNIAIIMRARDTVTLLAIERMIQFSYSDAPNADYEGDSNQEYLEEHLLPPV
jgi:hypothetical protein